MSNRHRGHKKGHRKHKNHHPMDDSMSQPINNPMMMQPQQGGDMNAMMMQMQAKMRELEEKTRKIPWTEHFEKSDGVFIKQKFDLFEALSGCEMPNVYGVYPLATGNQKKRKNPVMICKEKEPGCFRRCFYPPDCKPFEIECFDEGDELEDVVLEMIRPYSCAWKCLNRPEMKVNLIRDGQSVYIGKVRDNWDCCNFSFSIYDNNDTIVYWVVASCCQLAFHFKKCPFGPCEKVVFDVYKGEKEVMLDEKMVKTGKGCAKNMLGDADNFSVPFPKGAPIEHRVLLMTCALMVDYCMFEEQDDKKTKKVSVKF